MQLGTKENENERFKHYIDKSYRKTASLIANSCKSVSISDTCLVMERKISPPRPPILIFGPIIYYIIFLLVCIITPSKET